MSTTLVAEFMGLMLFVAQGKGKPLDVIAVNGEYSSKGCPMGVHDPWLTVDARDVDWTQSVEPTTTTVGPDGTRLALWDLRYAAVSVEIGGAAPSGGVEVDYDVKDKDDDDRPGVALFRRFASWKDFGWLANLKLASGYSIDEKHLTNTPGANTPVSSRIHLTGGKLETERPYSSEFRNEVWDFKYKGGAVTHTRALSDGAAWRLRTDQAIAIVLRRGSEDHKIALGGARARVHVTFSNTPHHVVSGVQASIDHFAAYYELLTKPPACDERPIPWLSAERQRFYEGRPHTGVGSNDCPSAGVDFP